MENESFPTFKLERFQPSVGIVAVFRNESGALHFGRAGCFRGGEARGMSPSSITSDCFVIRSLAGHDGVPGVAWAWEF